MKTSFAWALLAAWAICAGATQVGAQEPIRLKVDSADLAPQGTTPAPSTSTFQRPVMQPIPTSTRPLAHKSLRAPIASVVGVRGFEENVIRGYGVVMGLSGTGDSGELVKQFLSNELLRFGHKIDASQLSSKNMAIVRVDANLPAGSKPGQLVDVRVSTVGDATSLQGGNLDFCELFDPRYETVYATAAGPIEVGGFTAKGEGGTSTKNHTTVGFLSGGGKVQREVETAITNEHGFILLDAKKGQATFGNMVAVAEAVNRLYPNAAAVEPDGSTVKVAVPSDLPKSAHGAYLNTILKQEIETDNKPRVVVNERTGVIVIGGDVRLRPGAIAHGAIVVTVAESPQASQPAPLSGGTTEVLPRSDVNVTEEAGSLVPIHEAVTLQEVVDVLNVLGASPRDLISILSAMSDGGLLVADIRRL
ncbi:MAG TPA: flagellar basal body P-ring protein FlgI [Planctomycetota bacterium]|nr:flagellar basal body P-ring protein FlgI [Planctomycetota bacterium]